MRPLDPSETAIDTVVSSKYQSGLVDMEYSDSGGQKEGQQQPLHHQQQQQQQRAAAGYSLTQESRQQQQQQHRLAAQQLSWAQQQAQQQQPQHGAYPQHQPQAFGGRPYTQQDIMAAAPPVVDPHSSAAAASEYAHLSAAAIAAAQQQQQQQYLRQHAAVAAGGATSYAAAAYNPRQYPQLAAAYQQQMALQQSMMGGGAAAAAAAAGVAPPQQLLHPGHHPGMDPSAQLQVQQQQQQQPYIQPKVGRLPADRPLIKLSVSLIDTYKHINTVYYEERDARRAARAKEKAQKGQGTNNNGWDDENYDYIITSGELFYDKYRIKERIGKGSFGQVVRAEDLDTQKDVAIKIIKSKKPFLMQAKTEIELLSHLNDKDPDDQHNVVRLLTHFMYRNHQCLVFEMLSLNLYELLKNTQFGGVSLNLIRKFAKQVLKSLLFLARSDVDIIHCDLKPENILLRHPKKSGVKVIDFGSSCRSNKRMYSYIQSRFYRSPEVMLGLPYSTSIDMWSLGCILAEMHTGEPLFSGSDQFDQMQKIVKLLGMVPTHMLDQANDHHRLQFFERGRDAQWAIKQVNTGTGRSSSSSSQQQQQQSTKQVVVPSRDPIASLTEVIKAETHRKKKYPPSETGNSPRNYELFVDLIFRMLAYDPRQRIKPEDALNHPFIIAGEQISQQTSQQPETYAAGAQRKV